MLIHSANLSGVSVFLGRTIFATIRAYVRKYLAGGKSTMTMKRTGADWIPADSYGCSLPRFTVNLLVRDVQRSVPFYCDVLQASVHCSDEDFAALELQGTQFMLHADHTYDHHPYAARLHSPGLRGSGVELRVMGIDPDEVKNRARACNVKVFQPTKDFPHGWRGVMLEDPRRLHLGRGNPDRRGTQPRCLISNDDVCNLGSWKWPQNGIPFCVCRIAFKKGVGSRREHENECG
jgi:hypothetical protein